MTKIRTLYKIRFILTFTIATLFTFALLYDIIWSNCAIQNKCFWKDIIDSCKEKVYMSPRHFRYTNVSDTICTRKHKNVAFLKVHKAGSTTVMTMFLRFAEAHNLNVILPRPLNYLGFDKTINVENVHPPPPNEQYNILCNHVVYNKTAFYKFMPADTIFTAIVRNPVSLIISATQFFGIFEDFRGVYGNKSEQELMSAFLKSPNNTTKLTQKFLKTRMALDFGISAKDLISQETVQNYLEILNKDFLLVMIMEMFDESLILLKRYLCWDLKDVVYVPLNAISGKAKIVINGDDLQNLKRYNWPDFILYDFFKTKFLEKIKNEGEDFKDEVQNFKHVIKQVGHYCGGKRKDQNGIHILASKWNNEFFISNEECNFITLHEYDLVYRIVMKYKRKLQRTGSNIHIHRE